MLENTFVLIIFKLLCICRSNKALMCICISIMVIALVSCGGMSSSHSHQQVTPWIRSISCVGPDHAWLSTRSGDVFSTTNGGNIWSKTSLQAGNQAEMVYFLDSQSGWMINRKREVWKTVDGGNKWMLITNLGSLEKDKYGMPVNDMWFLGPSLGWIVDSTAIWRTEDTGQNWQPYYPAYYPKEMAELIFCGRFATPQIGWLGGTHGIIFLTSDGGKTWESKELGPENSSFIATGIIGSNYGWLMSSDGTLYFSKDQGKSWTMQSDVLNDERHIITSASFVSEIEGWA